MAYVALHAVPVADIDKHRSKWNRTTIFCGIYAGPLFLVALMVLFYYVAVWHMVPQMSDDQFITPANFLILGHYFLGMVVINLYCFIYYSKNNDISFWQRQSCVAEIFKQAKDDVEGGDSDGPMSRYCVDCNLSAPIRSYHCPICRMCVLRKDHHCFVTGHCVGLGNQRYFILFLFWTVIALTLFITYNSRYIGAHPETPDLLPFGFIYMIGPFAIARWMIGYASFSFTCYCVFYSFAVCGFFSAAGFLIVQIFYTYYGYTMYEYHNLKCRETFPGDGDSISERFRLVFGRYWALNFIFPLFWEQPVLTPAIADNLFRVRAKVL